MPESTPDYYNRLLEQRRSEYASKGLAKMPPDFLGATARYLSGMRELLEKEVRENPTSRKVELTRTTYQRALASARDVLEARLAKIAQQAAQHVNLGGEPANLLPEERALYDQIAQSLSSFRRTSAPFLETSSAPPTASSPVASAPVPPKDRAPAPSPAAATPPPVAPAVTPTAAPLPSASSGPQVVVRILQDRPALALRNETIELHKEDLLTLPADKAELLIHAKVAERVEVRRAATVT